MFELIACRDTDEVQEYFHKKIAEVNAVKVNMSGSYARIDTAEDTTIIDKIVEQGDAFRHSGAVYTHVSVYDDMDDDCVMYLITRNRGDTFEFRPPKRKGI